MKKCHLFNDVNDLLNYCKLERRRGLPRRYVSAPSLAQATTTKVKDRGDTELT